MIQKALHTYHQDPTFWHALTRTTFRIPDQPLLRGARWQWLYKKLLTQTRLYTWGDNKSGNLGHENPGPQTQRLSPRAAVHGRAWRTEAGSAGWPKQPLITEDVGIVADVQCGWVETREFGTGKTLMLGAQEDGRLRSSIQQERSTCMASSTDSGRADEQI